MVRLPSPPPLVPPNPLFHNLPKGSHLVRLFDPTKHSATATSFRYFGPLARFDHHCALNGEPQLNPNRSVYYAALTLSCCIVEIFGDTRIIDCGNWRAAVSQLNQDLRLLDLRKSGAMRAGTVAAVGQAPDHTIAQAWSRHFYTEPAYKNPDGLIWHNAHNGEEAVMLYERAQSAIFSLGELPLVHQGLRPELQIIALENNLTLSR